MPNGWRTINSLVHKIRLHGRRGKGMAESFSRQKSRHAPQKEGGLKILCDLPPVWPRLVRPTNLMSRMDGKKTHTHRRKKKDEKSCVTFLLCDPGWYVQRAWCPEWMGRKHTQHTHTHGFEARSVNVKKKTKQQKIPQVVYIRLLRL